MCSNFGCSGICCIIYDTDNPIAADCTDHCSCTYNCALCIPNAVTTFRAPCAVDPLPICLRDCPA
jgi:hypothetical protein